MQQGSGTSPPAVAEPSRRRPPRQRLTDPVPIPEVSPRPRPRPVRAEDVLAAHQRAIEERLEDGLLRIQEAVTRAARTAVAEAVADAALSAPPVPPDAGEVSRALLVHAEERLQAVTIRLQRIEDALQTLAARSPRDEAIPELARVAVLLREVGRRQGEAMAKLARAHHAAIERLAQHQRESLEDLGRRTGRGVTAVARELHRAIEDDLEEVRTSIRSMRRAFAWEGTAPGRLEPPIQPRVEGPATSA